MSVVNTNMMSLTAQRSLSTTTSQLQTAMQRLSSGLRVNSSKDDAAGLAIATGMTSQIRGMMVAIRNANDGISMAQVAEGAMDSMTQNLQRMRDLALQSMNGSNSDGDKANLQKEFLQLQAELRRTMNVTQFNGRSILKGSVPVVAFQVGANNTGQDVISVKMSALSMQVGSLINASGVAYSYTFGSVAISGGFSIGSGTSIGQLQSTLAVIDVALKIVNDQRAKLGAVQNRFDMTITNLQNAIVNQSAARSRIMDADFATETAALSRAQILQQAGTAMLAQANAAPQQVLSLLK